MGTKTSALQQSMSSSPRLVVQRLRLEFGAMFQLLANRSSSSNMPAGSYPVGPSTFGKMVYRGSCGLYPSELCGRIGIVSDAAIVSIEHFGLLQCRERILRVQDSKLRDEILKLSLYPFYTLKETKVLIDTMAS